ncbi:MAG: hypothetical protein CR988_05170 [Treponema sp.]|nr:MAG: hypothetical protein CR988_05170 [Treponema sp.]
MNNDVNWYNIDEKFWNSHYKKMVRVDQTMSVKRVYPLTDDYKKVVQLRYAGLVESGFLDMYKDRPESMILERDTDSVILGLYEKDKMLGTLTLNTRTRRFKKLAMEIEKKVKLKHPFFNIDSVLEFTKLVLSPEGRIRKGLLNLCGVAFIIGNYFNKVHYWQVSRDIPEDIRFRERLGFDYSNGYIFNDPSLNGMPSRAGYFDSSKYAENSKIPTFLVHMYDVLKKQKFK